MIKYLKKMVHNKKAECFVAIGAFLAACVLAMTSVIINEDHDVSSGVLMMCAQFLTLTATIFGLDYKFGVYERRINSGSAADTH